MSGNKKITIYTDNGRREPISYESIQEVFRFPNSDVKPICELQITINSQHDTNSKISLRTTKPTIEYQFTQPDSTVDDYLNFRLQAWMEQAKPTYSPIASIDAFSTVLRTIILISFLVGIGTFLLTIMLLGAKLVAHVTASSPPRISFQDMLLIVMPAGFLFGIFLGSIIGIFELLKHK